jgi:predicted metalloprotease with PDZ domain
MTTLPIQYSLSIPDVNAHLAEVSIHIPTPAAGPLTLAMPSWTPGSYLMREFARHVQQFTAADHSGTALTAQKTARGLWEVEVPVGGVDVVVVTYRLYAHDLSPRCNHVTDEHAFFNGASAFMYVQGMEDLPCTLDIEAPFPDWKIYTALPNQEGATFPLRTGRFDATDYDHFIDCPILLGAHQELSFPAAGTTHRFVFAGRAPVPTEQLALDIPPLVQATADLFEGDIPYESYLHIVLHTESARGGLEHRNCAALLFPRNHWVAEHGYEDFLALVSHEHFHAWNVKRIRPQVLGPFDYHNEAYTRALWVMEGVTCYYESILLLRAGLITEERYLELLAKRIADLRQVPGRRLHSLEEASFDAWIKFYRRDESTQNTTVSYYLKGEVIACLLDLHIRRKTDGEASLDDMMRRLWARYRAEGTGYPEGAFQGWLEDIAGGSLENFFDRFVRGTVEPDFDAHLAPFGLHLSAVDHEPGKAFLGISTREVGDSRMAVDRIKRGSPAEAAGVYPGDELVALDGMRLDRKTQDALLRRFSPGVESELHVFRRGELRCVTVRFGSAPVDKYAILPADNPSAEAESARRKWLAV